METRRDEMCGSAAAGQPLAETRPLYQLLHLVAFLERQSAEKQRTSERPLTLPYATSA